MIGPGKYDELATCLRTATGATGVVLVVIDGQLGSGFSCQIEAKALAKMPAVLRQVADQLEKDFKRVKGKTPP